MDARAREIRNTIEEFLQGRLNDKLEKLKPGEEEKAERLRVEHERGTWLAEAARRASQIQIVTHSLKPMHPDARGTNLFCVPEDLPKRAELASHCLTTKRMHIDAVGNAAALDVFKFLKLQCEAETLLALMQRLDAATMLALSDDKKQASEWGSALCAIADSKKGASSHELAKQVFWFVSQDVHVSDSFHLLTPLFPTSLVHSVYGIIQEHRFGEVAKAARSMRAKQEYASQTVYEYSNLAVQNFGGTKPQNISQLNSERRGENYLLSSMPPKWISKEVRPILKTESLFHSFQRRRSVRDMVKEFREFLGSDPNPNLATRNRVAMLVDAILDELVQYVAAIRMLTAGWSAHNDCWLAKYEKSWLDPQGAEGFDWIEPVAATFANWLNAQLRDPLPMGNPEFVHWQKIAGEQLEMEG